MMAMFAPIHLASSRTDFHGALEPPRSLRGPRLCDVSPAVDVVASEDSGGAAAPPSPSLIDPEDDPFLHIWVSFLPPPMFFFVQPKTRSLSSHVRGIRNS